MTKETLIGKYKQAKYLIRKKLARCYVWSIALHVSETRTLRKLERKYLESFEMWCWRRMDKIKWSEKVTNVTNEQVLECIGEKRTLLSRIANWSDSEKKLPP